MTDRWADLDRRLDALDAQIERIRAINAESQRQLDAIKARQAAQAQLDHMRLEAVLDRAKLRPVNYARLDPALNAEDEGVPLWAWIVAGMILAAGFTFALLG